MLAIFGGGEEKFWKVPPKNGIKFAINSTTHPNEGVAELAEEAFKWSNLSPLLSKEGLGVVSHSLLSKAMIFI